LFTGCIFRKSFINSSDDWGNEEGYMVGSGGVGEWGNGGGALELKFDSKFKNFYKNELISTQIINFLVNV
jgi:hypothetical protein